jgi:hypothetical protein
MALGVGLEPGFYEGGFAKPNSELIVIDSDISL